MADMKPQGTQAYGIESGYETGDANVRAVVQGLGIIFVSTLVVMAAMFGMFNYLNHRELVREAQIPAATTRVIIPPEPRLLPSPYADTHDEAKALGASSEDSFPWDKRSLEIVQQYDEANHNGAIPADKLEVITDPTTAQEEAKKDNKFAIDIKSAMSQMAGGKDGQGGSPSAMPWQHEYPRMIAGSSADGKTMNLDPGKKQLDARIFDQRPYWESQDEKFTADASGGKELKPGGLSR